MVTTTCRRGEADAEDLVLTALDRGKSRIRFENCPPGAYALYNQALSEQWAEVDLRVRWRTFSRVFLDAGLGTEISAYREEAGDFGLRAESPLTLGVGFTLW
jgi:hypothetical protein